MTSPTPSTAPTTTPRSPRRFESGPWLIGLIVLVAAVVAVGGFVVVRSVTAPDAPDTPGGLTLQARPGRVVASWDPVSGASAYQLLRGDGYVVHQGPETSAEDVSVPAGEHDYRVIAIRAGVYSEPGPVQRVRTGASWGEFAPLVAQFPELLPQAPDTAAQWMNTECIRRYSGGRDEVGPSETGAGQVRTVFVVRCAAGSVDRPFGVFWFASRDALNAEYSRSSETSRPVRWRHGTGLIDENGRGVFKITDDPSRELAMIVVLETDGQDILDMVDSLPL